MGRAVKRHHVEKGAIEYGDLVENTVEFEIAIPLGYIPEGQDMGTTGVKYESKRYLISDQLKKHLKRAYFETDLQEITGGTVALECFDYTAGAAIATLTRTTTTKRARATISLADLVAGNAVGVRYNVTVAATGAVGGGCSPVLVLVYGIS